MISVPTVMFIPSELQNQNLRHPERRLDAEAPSECRQGGDAFAVVFLFFFCCVLFG